MRDEAGKSLAGRLLLEVRGAANVRGARACPGSTGRLRWRRDQFLRRLARFWSSARTLARADSIASSSTWFTMKAS